MPETLELLIRSGNTLISIETTDEQRAVERVRDVVRKLAQPLFEWSTTTGLRPLQGDGIIGDPVVQPGDAQPALEHLHEGPVSAVYVFKDLGLHCRKAFIHRLVRDVALACSRTASTIVMIDALALPSEIRRFAVRYQLGWPDATELEQVVRRTFKRIKRESLQNITSKISKRDMNMLIQSLRGLSSVEAERVVASAIFDDYALTSEDLPRIVESKRTLLGSSGCLESIAADVDMTEVGGLDNLKSWLAKRRHAFTPAARKFGLELPRGILMLGVPGCGKSLCAKAVASDWNMGLLRLDPGVLYQKFIGESESQLRQALAQAEAMAPMVLWIDEIEKAFASASTSSADGGLSKRMFGTLLSWMQDHRHPIFIVATANDIAALPPELMRKGRFDEVFFVELPSPVARRQILSIHCQRRKRDPGRFDLDDLVRQSEGFGGSELEEAVRSGMFTAFTEGVELETRHIAAALNATRPLSKLMQEDVAALRAWAAHRCVPAD